MTNEQKQPFCIHIKALADGEDPDMDGNLDEDGDLITAAVTRFTDASETPNSVDVFIVEGITSAKAASVLRKMASFVENIDLMSPKWMEDAEPQIELIEEGRVIDSGERRGGQIVWVAATKH